MYSTRDQIKNKASNDNSHQNVATIYLSRQEIKKNY